MQNFKIFLGRTPEPPLQGEREGNGGEKREREEVGMGEVAP